jgi:hypothetical protein
VFWLAPTSTGLTSQNTHTLAVKEKEYEVNEAVKEQDDTVVEQDVEQDEADTTTAKEITGEKFTDEVDNLLIKLVALLERAKALTALRFGKNKTLSEISTEALSGLRDALQDAHNEVDTLLRGAGNENVEVQDDLVEVNELWLQTTNLLADTIDL